jgi:hypothetical protein
MIANDASMLPWIVHRAESLITNPPSWENYSLQTDQNVTG